MLIRALKHLPIDLGQGRLAERTEGKQIALRLVPPGAGCRALDVGCRAGKQTAWLRERGYDVVSIDIEKQWEDCRVVDANEPLPFADAAFDLVWCSEVIEHLDDPPAVLDEFRRVTRPGGDILLTTPNSYMLPLQFLRLFGLTPQKLQNPGHRHFFNLDDIRRLAPDAAVYGFFPYILVKRTIRCCVGALSPTFVLHIRV